MRHGSEFGGKTEEREREQYGERAHVEDPLDGPDCELRGKGKTVLFADQVRAYEFAGTAEQREPSKADKLGRQHASSWDVFQRPEEDFPAESAQPLSGINKVSRQEDAHKARWFGEETGADVAELVPREIAVFAELEIEEAREDECDNDQSKDVLTLHERSYKVNDREGVVKLKELRMANR